MLFETAVLIRTALYVSSAASVVSDVVLVKQPECGRVVSYGERVHQSRVQPVALEEDLGQRLLGGGQDRQGVASMMSSRPTYMELSIALGLIAAIRACSEQLACRKAIPSPPLAAPAMSASPLRNAATSAAVACQTASLIKSKSSALRIRTASVTDVRSESKASITLPSRTMGAGSQANNPPPGPGRTVTSPRA